VLRAVRSTGGAGAMVTDEEVVEGIQLLAETEGIFTEPAGGVTVAATRKLIARGALPRDESIVICITGNGYKTIEVMSGRGREPLRIGRSLADFEAAHAADLARA
jgi:threonine synthase